MTPQDFIVHEAQLLDEQRWEDWLALFAQDGRYWVPLDGAAQAEGDRRNSLADEDHLLLSLRIARLRNPKAYSMHPPARGQHVLQAPMVVSQSETACELRTPFVYIESRAGHQVVLPGRYTHRLVREAGGWRIRLKRVDLLESDQALPMIQLFP